jgi:hypothetical protein
MTWIYRKEILKCFWHVITYRDAWSLGHFKIRVPHFSDEEIQWLRVNSVNSRA